MMDITQSRAIYTSLHLSMFYLYMYSRCNISLAQMNVWWVKTVICDRDIARLKPLNSVYIYWNRVYGEPLHAVLVALHRPWEQMCYCSR